MASWHFSHTLLPHSRTYPLHPPPPSHKKVFCTPPPHPLQISIKLHTFLKNFCFFHPPPPSPLEFPLTFCGGCVNIFWKCTTIALQATSPCVVCLTRTGTCSSKTRLATSIFETVPLVLLSVPFASFPLLSGQY